VRDAVTSIGIDTVVVDGSMREAFVADMASQGLTRRPGDPESVRSLRRGVRLGARARRRAGLRPWLLAHPVDLVIVEVESGAALAPAGAVRTAFLRQAARAGRAGSGAPHRPGRRGRTQGGNTARRG